MIELVLLGVVQMGKTFALAVWLYMQAWTKPGTLSWWAAPTYSQAEVGFREMRGHLEPRHALARVAETRLRLDLVNGSRIECRSWEREENLLGSSVDGGIVIDQGELLTGRARSNISSRRAASMAPMRIAGNAGIYGQEFWRLCRQADEAQRNGSPAMGFVRWSWRDRLAALAGDERDRYQAFIDQEQENLPGDEFRRLYESEFLTTGAGLIQLRPVCTNGGTDGEPVRLPFAEPWDPDEDCVAGLDLGQEIDYSVLTILGQDTGRLKAADRFKNLAWRAQAVRIAEILSRYSRTLKQAKETGLKPRSVSVFVDATGLGSPVWEILEEETARLAIDLTPIKFTADRKHRMVTAVQVASEQRLISMPYIAEYVLEGDTLERKLTQNGMTYAAAPGFHDDCFWSLGLACLARSGMVG